MTMEQGYVQVYTGDGKGKTTAAVGLAMRAAAANLRVCFCQFMKCGPTGELDAFRLFGDLIACEQFGTGDELSAPDATADAQAAKRGLAVARDMMLSGAYDVVVLDEANVADSLGYFGPDALVDLVLERPENVELVGPRSKRHAHSRRRPRHRDARSEALLRGGRPRPPRHRVLAISTTVRLFEHG